MAKLKEVLALLISISLILSNLAFAKYDPGYYEGRPIDPEKEGREYYREGDVIVYPAKMGSEEKMMMKRFNRGELSEEEMRRMAKEKFGDEFDEMEFKKGMMEFRERMERKETFSYEHEGYRRYDYGPSYEGYSKEHMIFGMLFEKISNEVDPSEIRRYCNEPNKIADEVISKLKEKIGDFQNVCKIIDEEGAKCEEYSKKGCSQIGTAYVREDATELEKINSIAYSCPVKKDAIIEACKKRSRLYLEKRIENLDEDCKERFDYEGERLVKECERFRQNQICDKDKYMERCMGGIKKEDFKTEQERRGPGFSEARWECHDGTVESQSDTSCRASEAWEHMARKSCEGRCNKETGKCGVYSFSIGGECKDQMRCPEQVIPDCGEVHVLRKKVDSNGCGVYFCEKESVCPRDVKQCPDGSYVVRVPPNCDFQPCPSVACSKPICDGAYNTGRIDSNGCVVYECPATTTCPQVSKPSCGSNEKLEAYYDNRGCVTSYQCIKYETACPTVSKPACSEGQSLTTKYDDRGCVTAYECVTVTQSSSITGAAVASTYDDFKIHCEDSWAEQQKICLNVPQACDKESFVQRCKEQEKKSFSNFELQIAQNCEVQIQSEIDHAEQRCLRIDEDRKRCVEEGKNRCEKMKGLSEKCKELMTEEKVKEFILKEVKKRCKFTDIIENEEDIKKSNKAEIVLAVLNTATERDIDKLKLFVDGLQEDLKLQDTTVYRGTIDPNRFGDVKLLPFVVNAKLSAAPSSEKSKEVKEKLVASTKVEETASKLVSLRNSDVPDAYLYIIEDKASEVIDAAEELEDVEKKEEKKGIGYKIKRFFGLAKKAEQEEIKQLEDSKAKLQNSIDTLAKLIDEVPSDVAKAILTEQVESLKQQQTDIEILIETKGKKAKGLFGVFG